MESGAFRRHASFDENAGRRRTKDYHGYFDAQTLERSDGRLFWYNGYLDETGGRHMVFRLYHFRPLGRIYDECGHWQTDQLLFNGSLGVVIPVLRPGNQLAEICENSTGRGGLWRNVGSNAGLFLQASERKRMVWYLCYCDGRASDGSDAEDLEGDS